VKWMLPRYFSRIPKIPLEVRRVPLFAEKGSPGAYYERPSLDGSRPGIFFANLRNTAETPMWAMPTLAYHEGIPGHHLQFSIAQEQSDLPAFRRFAYYNAYSEGWAFYAERLGREVGFYEDPYSEYGRLENEMWRSVRLVVDTGVHAKHWSRQQMVDYFRKYTAMDEQNIETEVDRYIAWPGQALSYYLGERTILEGRARAERALGERFNIRAFHDAVLELGSVPLPVLTARIDRFIADGGKGPYPDME